MLITPAWCHVMARYNEWQNRNLVGAAATLDDAARNLDRGAFFGSIQRTFSHLLWGDTIWMSRFDGGEAGGGGFADSAVAWPEWEPFVKARARMDARILSWAGRLTPEEIEGQLTWYSGAMKRELSKPRAICFMQLFNHQTHHRGQIHAMLTAAGARPGDTDLPFMPDSI